MVVVLQHLITRVNLRCGLTARSIACIARRQSGACFFERGLQTRGLLLGMTPCSANLERDLDEDLESGIRKDDRACIASVGDDPVYPRLFAELLHALGERSAYFGMVRDFGDFGVDCRSA